jgi:hypothetical protein
MNTIGKAYIVMATDKHTRDSWAMCVSLDRATALEEIVSLRAGQGARYVTYHLETANLVADIGRPK